MKRTQYVTVLAMAMLAGLIGGLLSSRFMSVEPAWAQQRHRVVNSEEFLLVDRSGKTRGGLGVGTDGGVGLVLTDREGTKTLYISPDEAQVFRLYDKTGKTLWAAP